MTSAYRPTAREPYGNQGYLALIPSRWAITRIKYLFRETELRNVDGADPLLSLTKTRGLVPFSDATKRLASASDLRNYKVCLPGQLVFNRMQAWSGMFAVAEMRGAVSPDYSVFAAFGDICVRYFEALFKTPMLMRIFAQASRGIGTGFNRLYTPDFGAIHVPLPPLDEQAAIVKFLTHADQRIRRYLRAKQRLLALLEEQKQALIHRAVTRGLDPGVRLKPSGVEWLGEVPEHWRLVRLKTAADRIVDCVHATPTYAVDGSYPAIRTADVFPGELRWQRARCVDAGQFAVWTSRLEPRAGDILYSREGERFGIAALVPEGVRLCISQRMMAIRIDPAHVSSYFMWQLNCAHVYSQASVDTIGSTSPHVNVERVRNFVLTAPPENEQGAIVAYIDVISSTTSRAVSAINQRIDRVREYRTRLIADVVTGQLDVRAAAAQLPDLPADLAELDAPAGADDDSPGGDVEVGEGEHLPDGEE